jgi:hypothetical protein
LSALSDLLAQPFLLKPDGEILGDDSLSDAPNPPVPAPGTRLGRYVEALLEHAIRARGLPYAARIPVRRGNETLGELDFVFQKEDGSWEHWEVAYKLYLYHPAIAKADSFADFIGPNNKDRLDLKLGHMRRQQLALASTPEAVKAIRERLPDFDPNRLRSRIWLKGRLFLPEGSSFPPHPGLNPHALTGTWGTRPLHGAPMERTEAFRLNSPAQNVQLIEPQGDPILLNTGKTFHYLCSLAQ